MRTEASAWQADSTVREVLTVRTEAVPKSEVRLELPADSLLRLPPGAQYGGRSGQASVTVSREQDVITVYASCDSLQRLVEHYERSTSAWQARCEELSSRHETETRRRSNGLRMLLCGLAAGAAAGITGTLTIEKLIQKRKKDGD